MLFTVLVDEEARNSETNCLLCVLGVDRHSHHIVAMALKDLNTFPILLPIPQLNGHVITSGENVRQSWVDND